MKGVPMLALRLPQEIEQRLTTLAQRTGRTKSFYARQAIEIFLDDLEDRYWEDEVVARWEASDKKTYSSEEFDKMFGFK
jgi:RHH-type rel operon transcriptional repressor/antitoxin RelB